MRTSNLITLSLVVFGCSLLSGCGSKQASEQAQAEARDEQAEQQANQGLAKVDHDIAAGLYGQKPAPPAPSSQPPPGQTTAQANNTPTPTSPPQ
jgi:hypothetical protein